MSARNPLGELIQSYIDARTAELRVRVTAADLARQTDDVVSEQVISKWRRGIVLPDPDSLFAFAKGTGLNYLELLDAALRGKGYLPIDGEVSLKLKGNVRQLDFARPDELSDEGGNLRSVANEGEIEEPGEFD